MVPECRIPLRKTWAGLILICLSILVFVYGASSHPFASLVVGLIALTAGGVLTASYISCVARLNRSRLNRVRHD